MGGHLASGFSSSLVLMVALVALSMVIAAIDLLRQPGWAWRRAEENKAAYLILVLLVPVIGSGMYVHCARSKVTAIARGGRAASLPFEQFGEDAARSRPDRHWPMGSVAPPKRFSGPEATALAGGTVYLVATFPEEAPATTPGATPMDRGRPYRPRQRTSIPVGGAPMESSSVVPAGWKADPTGRHQFRFWGGTGWTEDVADDGDRSRDPVAT